MSKCWLCQKSAARREKPGPLIRLSGTVLFGISGGHRHRAGFVNRVIVARGRCALSFSNIIASQQCTAARCCVFVMLCILYNRGCMQGFRPLTPKTDGFNMHVTQNAQINGRNAEL